MHAAMDVITFEHNESQEACSALLRNTVDFRRTKIIGIAISMLYVMLPQPHDTWHLACCLLLSAC